MPVYTYHCENCEHEFEKYQSFSEDSLTLCPECQQNALRKVYQPALVLFKGKGFYVTDSKSASPTMTPPPSSKDSPNGSKDSTSEKKTEKKAEKKETKAEKKASKDN